jgi:atlastin
VRDWSSPFEMNYGFAGGRNLLEQRLKVREEQVDYMKRVRIEIQRSFETLVCALMPHPGHSVAVSAPDFYGNLKGKQIYYFILCTCLDIPEEFKDQLRILVDSIVGPAKMSPKKINGNPVTCHELFVYFKSYAEIFSGGTLPEPKSLWWVS